MSTSFFNTPSPIDLIGLPNGKFLIHEFPKDMAAGETVKIVLNGVNKKLINFAGDKLQPDRHPKQPGKIVRHTEVSLRFPQKIRPIKLFLDMNSQIVFVFGRRVSPILVRPEILKPAEAHIITYYKKQSRKKVLNACFFGSGHPVADMHRAMAKCEVLMAVDTNYRDVPGTGVVAATTAIEAKINIVTDEACHLQSGPMRQKITIDPPGNPEIFGIGNMLHHFFETNPQLRDKSVGVITDTELDLIKGMNQRSIPFFETMLLPDNITLFYATRDSGSAEFMANKLIRMCDNASKDYLERYLNGGL
ncbi:MAG: hypothetical protein PHZ02_12435 [Desulfocapsaceae bacterium]|nr:hypothetical protein [Desulfocapsaceae bacterium]